MSKPMRILIIDDEQDVVDTIELFLVKEGYRVTCVSRGKQAITLLKKERHDIVLLDLKMPGLSGAETLREIKKIKPEPIVILLTGAKGCPEEMEALELGVFSHIYKPFEIDEVRETLKYATDKAVERRTRVIKPAKEHRKDTSSKKHILIVDDEELIRDLLARALSRLGYAITSVAKGEEALGLIKTRDIALVISDLRMPGIDGFELFRQCKKLKPKLPVICITGFGKDFDEPIEQLKREGLFACLPKPFEISELVKAVERAIEQDQ